LSTARRQKTGRLQIIRDPPRQLRLARRRDIAWHRAPARSRRNHGWSRDPGSAETATPPETSKWALATTIARGRGRSAAICLSQAAAWVSAIAVSGEPWEMNRAGNAEVVMGFLLATKISRLDCS
jgi:hypothetical protein